MNKKIKKISSIMVLSTLCISTSVAWATMPPTGGPLSPEMQEQLKRSTGQQYQNVAPSVPTPVEAVGAPASAPSQGVIMNVQPGTEGFIGGPEGDNGGLQGTGGVVAGDPNYDSEVNPYDPEVNLDDPVPNDPNATTSVLDWYAVGKELVTKYPNFSVYDVKTGVTWSAKYINGSNHADIIPASKSDAIKLNDNKITGDYVRRPVVVMINGIKYAGSMYAEGHGKTSYCDYFKGVMCIHFTGSKTHGTGKTDKDHQKAIQEALNY